MPTNHLPTYRPLGMYVYTNRVYVQVHKHDTRQRNKRMATGDTYQSQALSQYSPTGHVLLGFQLAKIQGTGEYEHVGHVHEPLQEGDCNLDRHALSRLDHIQLTLHKDITVSIKKEETKHLI